LFEYNKKIVIYLLIGLTCSDELGTLDSV